MIESCTVQVDSTEDNSEIASFCFTYIFRVVGSIRSLANAFKICLIVALHFNGDFIFK